MVVLKSLRVFALLVIAALSFPAVAASGNNKIYNLTTDLLSVPAGTAGATANVTFANVSPDGNSTFKSLKLFAPAGITVTAASVQTGSSYTAAVTVRDAAGNIVPAGTPGTAVWVDTINLPVKPFTAPFVVTLTVNAACSGGGPWATVSGNKENVWTGTGWTGQQFAQNNLTPASPYSTSITGACTFSYNVSGIPGGITAGITTASTAVTVSNAAASAASISSLSLAAPSNVTVALVSPPAGVTLSGNTINIAGPIAAGANVVFNITLTSPASCSTPSGGGPWTVGVSPPSFTGNTPSTPISASSCTLEFVNQPNNALAGQKITKTSFDPTGPDVTLLAKVNGSSAGSGVSVSLTSSASCPVTGGTATTDGSGVASFSSLTSNPVSTQNCTLTAKATNYTDSAPSSSFRIVAGATGVLGCSSGNNTAGGLGSLVLTQSGFEGTADWGLVRGNNWGGDLNCTLVPYVFSFDGSTGVASFLVDDGIKGAQLISAEYVVLFNPVPLSAWPNFQPKLAWGSPPFGSGGATPAFADDYVPGLSCLDDDVNGVNVLPPIPTGADPFATDYATAASVGSGNPQYAAPGLAKMCIANHGWTAMTLPYPNAFGLPAGSYIQPWYKVIDRSDGYLRLP
jgi:hypothetical protein